ncbi:MAG TPA: TlpA disulfide reductase family protein [Bryobacteraceae bacterium]|nr:TlpA disulfide reductase family protein [Bryobacteraceae bacterium]
MSRIQVAAVSSALVLFLAGCSHPRELKSEGQRQKAPNFTLKDADGNSVNLTDYRGKVVLVNFWATWCGPCEIEIPWFVEFEKKYKDQGFAVLGLSMDDDGWKSVRPYIASHKINYRVMIASEVVSQQFGDIAALPTSFVLDREGRIATNHVGLVDKRDYQNEILKLLEVPKTAAVRDADADVGPGALAVLTGAGVRAGQRP